MSSHQDLKTGPVVYTTSTASPTSSLPDFDFEKRYEVSEKLSPLQSISPQSLHTKPWPERPQQLNKVHREEWRLWGSIVNCVMLMLPLPFFTLFAAAIVVDGNAVTKQQSDHLDFAVKSATTLFPIFFGASTGRAAIKFATWKLEQGTNLGHLEQLMGSRTIWSTFMTHFQLRSFNAIGMVLMLMWCFEPIGGQAVQRILTTVNQATKSDTAVSYINSRQQSYSAPMGAFQNQWFPGFSVLFGSALLSTAEVKQGSEDVWGNVKIPYFSSIRNTGVSADVDGWIELPKNFTPIYSSLFGIPVSDIQLGNTTFNMESTYMELSCGNMTVSAQGAPPAPRSDLISTAGPFLNFQNISLNDAWSIGYQGPNIAAVQDGNAPYMYPKSCPDCLPSDFTSKNFDAGTLAFQEFSGFDLTTTILCMPSQRYVESTIVCAKTAELQTCRVTAQRPSILPHMPASITPLSFPTVVMGLTALLPNSTPQYNAVNMVENYIYNPSAQATIISGETSLGSNDGETPLMSVSPKDFGDRFGQLLNSYMYASMWNATAYVLGAPFSGIDANRVGGNSASFIPAASSEDLTAMLQNQTAAFTVPASLITIAPVYYVYYSWLLVFLVATMVMLVASIVGVVYSRKTIVPDYLGYVSSLAKESQYIRMPDVGVNMDGIDKARLVKDVRVRLGDVSEQAMAGDGKGLIGRLAFARAEDCRGVKKGQLYI